MATQNYDARAAGIFYSGWWDDGWYTSTLLEAAVVPGSGGTIDLTFVGTDLTMQCAISNTGGPTTVASIDGGAFNTVTMPASANTWTNVTIATGLSDASHTVTIRFSTNFSYLGIRSANAFTVTGATPSISSTTTGFSTNIYHLGQLIGCVGLQGSWRSIVDTGGVGSQGYIEPSAFTAKWCDSAITFRSTATTLKMFNYLNGTTCRLYQDGSLVGSTITLANTSVLGWTTLATGLDGASHVYKITYNYNANYANTFYVLGLMAVGGTIDTTYRPTAGGYIAAHGDSITQGTTGTSNDSTQSYLFRLGAATNRPVLNSGYPSVGITNTPGSAQPVAHQNRWTDFAQYLRLHPSDIDYVIELGGVVDAGQTNLQTAAVFTGAVQSLLSNMRLCLPNATILCLGILPTTGSASANRTTFNGYKSTAVSNLNDPKIIYVNTDGWITPATDCTDGTHPNATGYGKIVTQLQSYVTSYAGPAAGGVRINPGLSGGLR